MKRAYLIWSFCCLAFAAGAQDFGDEDQISSAALDRVQAQRVAFITEKIDMTSKEAEKFWPVFNEYEREERKIRKRYQSDMRRVIDMSNEEAKQFLESRFDMEQELLDLKRQYFLRLADIISPRKLAGFNRADREFKKLLLNRIRANRRRGRN
ncbi:hypothetical protein [Flavilitoribacter nigricans]|uniref:Sensor of ECF-type sigma factor n=1 Tax=Flavilitoribacter nigricans (strain ATCC 23147 / DSM 23189 / NBRC 102662 / NCIMB 1420 / SS-2) TaxID=1122177 RepID=A0A2D0N5W9_FLAN2|nr:hypothetical protein [Flavilitoribacter nigricans]PHN03895.1 hypothetical protein CRP01_23770 [Flavilitoribacter nigricans DSM 23189 = NBRC 102662]